jgi:hypothetical protein
MEGTVVNRLHFAVSCACRKQWGHKKLCKSKESVMSCNRDRNRDDRNVERTSDRPVKCLLQKLMLNVEIIVRVLCKVEINENRSEK